MDFEFESADAYRGMNPSFVRSVWAKRREAEGRNKRGPKVTWTDEEKSLVGEMMEQGLTSGQIAAKMGKTPSSICGIVHKTPELSAIGFKSIYATRHRSALDRGEAR